MKQLIAALLLTATPAMAFDISDMSEAEKTEFGEAVREYLMANPEVLIESINVLETRRAAESVENDMQLVASNHEAIFEDSHSWVGGNPDGDLTIVEFFDYRCGYCRKVSDEVEEVVADDGNIRLVLKEFPILGQDSEASSRFAVAVKQIAGDEAYKKAHDALMELRSPATVETLRKIADDIGVDSEEIVNRMNTEDVTKVLRENRQLAERMAIQGTPTFIIGEDMLRGAPQQGLEAVIEAARAEKG